MSRACLAIAGASAAWLACLPAQAQVPVGSDPVPSILTWSGDRQLAGYRSIETIYRTTLVRRGAAASPLPYAAKALRPTVAHQGRKWALDEYLAAKRITGLLVLKDGQVVLERYALGRQPEERWISFSVTKSITSTLIGAAIRDGHIKSLDEPVTGYLPELKGGAYDGVTVRHLLTMTSGARWNEDYTDPKADVVLASRTPGEPGVPPLISYMRRLPRAAAPGTRFNYSTGETDLAGLLLERAIGMSAADYLSQKIWAPYGMEQDAVWMVGQGGQVRGGCCLAMTLRDYARFGLFIQQGGRAGGQDVLPDGWLAEATSIQARGDEPGGYGFFWWIRTDGVFEAAGIFGQMITFLPQERLIIVLNSAMTEAHSAETDQVVKDLFDGIRAAARQSGQ